MRKKYIDPNPVIENGLAQMSIWRMMKLLILLSLPLIAKAQYGTFPFKNPAELGKIHWLRDYDQALSEAKKKNLPVFILFQEVPGCSNCKNYGHKVLSHPLIAEAIETHFIPLAVYNNRDGQDKKVLDKYKEPSWNNPVVRIVNSTGKDICGREADFHHGSKTVAKIMEGIKLSGQTVPLYLQLLEAEWRAKDFKTTDTLFLAMYCFWSGEKEIADIEGVVATEAGYMHGKEVVRVAYDKNVTNPDKIVQKAKESNNADQVYGYLQSDSKTKFLPPGKYRKDADDKVYLRNSHYKIIPMTDLQKTKVNRSIATGKNPEIWLSPRQLQILKRPDSRPDVTGQNIVDIWY
ncbi:MAG: thioredoxin family protein [Saprospiraceae bacterium]|nr:thioredoxin family protein [Saprospiraceae bacterium]